MAFDLLVGAGTLVAAANYCPKSSDIITDPYALGGFASGVLTPHVLSGLLEKMNFQGKKVELSVNLLLALALTGAYAYCQPALDENQQRILFGAVLGSGANLLSTTANALTHRNVVQVKAKGE